ncbi:hypothetical protein R50076_26230 [Gilvimarinus japonicus]
MNVGCKSRCYCFSKYKPKLYLNYGLDATNLRDARVRRLSRRASAGGQKGIGMDIAWLNTRKEALFA